LSESFIVSIHHWIVLTRFTYAFAFCLLLEIIFFELTSIFLPILLSQNRSSSAILFSMYSRLFLSVGASNLAYSNNLYH